MMSSKRIRPPGPEDVYLRGPRKGQVRDKIDRKKRVLEKGPDTVLHLAFQDQSFLPLSTTVHLISEASEVYEIGKKKHSNIVLFDSSKADSAVLELCAMAHEYNAVKLASSIWRSLLLAILVGGYVGYSSAYCCLYSLLYLPR